MSKCCGWNEMLQTPHLKILLFWKAPKERIVLKGIIIPVNLLWDAGPCGGNGFYYHPKGRRFLWWNCILCSVWRDICLSVNSSFQSGFNELFETKTEWNVVDNRDFCDWSGKCVGRSSNWWLKMWWNGYFVDWRFMNSWREDYVTTFQTNSFLFH